MPKIGNGHPKGKLYYFFHNYGRKIAKAEHVSGKLKGKAIFESCTEDQNVTASTNILSSKFFLLYFYYLYYKYCVNIAKINQMHSRVKDYAFG